VYFWPPSSPPFSFEKRPAICSILGCWPFPSFFLFFLKPPPPKGLLLPRAFSSLLLSFPPFPLFFFFPGRVGYLVAGKCRPASILSFPSKSRRTSYPPKLRVLFASFSFFPNRRYLVTYGTLPALLPIFFSLSFFFLRLSRTLSRVIQRFDSSLLSFLPSFTCFFP